MTKNPPSKTCCSLKEEWAGYAMRERGWEVQVDWGQPFIYLWVSPRSGFYRAISPHYPPPAAITDAVRHKECLPVTLPHESIPALNEKLSNLWDLLKIQSVTRIEDALVSSGWKREPVQLEANHHAVVTWLSPRGNEHTEFLSDRCPPPKSCLMEALRFGDLELVVDVFDTRQ